MKKLNVVEKSEFPKDVEHWDVKEISQLITGEVCIFYYGLNSYPTIKIETTICDRSEFEKYGTTMLCGTNGGYSDWQCVFMQLYAELYLE